MIQNKLVEWLRKTTKYDKFCIDQVMVAAAVVAALVVLEVIAVAVPLMRLPVVQIHLMDRQLVTLRLERKALMDVFPHKFKNVCFYYFLLFVFYINSNFSLNIHKNYKFLWDLKKCIKNLFLFSTFLIKSSLIYDKNSTFAAEPPVPNVGLSSSPFQYLSDS